jgi:hypothetical protein
MDKKERRGKMERKKGKKKRGEREKEKRKGKFRHFITSIHKVKPFCQTFFKTASAPSKKLLHRRS